MSAAGGPSGRSARPHGAGRVRRTPQQARSRARVERLLAAADGLLAAEGYQALTVRRLAEHAEVPVGTIYQFFPDKQAIVDALARRYLDEFAGVIQELVDRAGRERWADPVQTLLDAFVGAYRDRPGYLAIWTGRHLSPLLRQADEENNALIADGLRRVLLAQLDVPDDAELARACQVAVRVCDALLQYAFRQGAQADADVLAELVRLERLYLADLLGRLTGR
ncbi:MAG TPA: TetR/AcrR family transcriptional regulator [Kineosporiaceae bacterium]|nr:TetR/AcrR family transcriptional regulator [Kineosporiaceae bacterium]